MNKAKIAVLQSPDVYCSGALKGIGASAAKEKS